MAAALSNGYHSTEPDTTVTVIDFVDDPGAVQNDSMLRVTITDRVDTFFMKAFGFTHFDISRTAVAECVLPLCLGSPESCFGDDPATGLEPGFWAQINGIYVAKAGGNRYGAGYLYGIEVEEGSSG